MSEYSKKLHIRKSDSVQDISLYTATSDIVSGQYIRLRDGSTLLYAALGSTTDSLASSLRIRKGDTVYAVLKSGYPTGSVTYKCNSPKEAASYTINLPVGTKKILLKGSFCSKEISKYISVTSSSVILRLLAVFNDNRGSYNHIVQVCKPNGDFLFTDNDGRGRFCSFWASISWSPAINNS